MLRIQSFLTPAVVASAICLSVMARPAGAGQSNASGACALLPQAEIEQAVGAAIKSGEQRLAIESASACRFTVKGGGLIMVVMRRLGRRDWMSEQIARMASYPQRFHEVTASVIDHFFLT